MNNLLHKIDVLYLMWKQGNLGGEVMPEDENPNLEKSSPQNFLYFTLPMALNYQRNSYKLWESANKTYKDSSTNFVFNPNLVIKKPFEEVQAALTKYKVALQPNKQTQTWVTLCKTFVELTNGDVKEFLNGLDNDIIKIKEFIQKNNKSKFPYLAGNKICNYWLYVLLNYTDVKFKNVEHLTIAVDTHVIQATHKLGLISDEEQIKNNVQEIVAKRWEEVLKETKYKPIDLHTPLWLWSRNGFKELDFSLIDNKN